MSEFTTPADVEIFEDFESAGVRSLHAEILEYQRLLNETPVTSEEAQAIVEYLDSKWVFYGSEMRISGRITTLERIREADDGAEHEGMVRDTSDFTVKEIMVDDLPVISRGFNVFSRSAYVAGEEIGKEIVLGHYFEVRQEKLQETTFLGQTASIRGIAKLTDIILELPGDTTESLVHQINYFFPESASDIDERMLNSSNVSEAVLALNGLCIKGNTETNPEALGLLNNYLNSLVDFDKEIPYQIAHEGLYYVVAPDNVNHMLPHWERMMQYWAYPVAVELLPATEISEGCLVIDDSTYVPAVRLNPLHREDDQPGEQQLVVPITEDFFIASIRNVLYKNATAS